MYHSGFTGDLSYLCSTYASDYEAIYLLGYSLGGNQVSRYICDGEHVLPDEIKRAVAISVPTDLADSAEQLAKWSNYIYTIGFLRTLKDKGLAKAEQFPELLSADAIDSVKTLVAFDDVLTAPLHGFDDAADYYQRCSSLPYLHAARRPLLMINAADDPFLGDRCYPVDIAERSKAFHLLLTKRGGHVGFMQPSSPWTYAEEQALAFCEASDYPLYNI
jgi:predicted alpha/beta-fold hydrolase